MKSLSFALGLTAASAVLGLGLSSPPASGTVASDPHAQVLAKSPEVANGIDTEQYRKIRESIERVIALGKATFGIVG
jgi:hypothetical protein